METIINKLNEIIPNKNAFNDWTLTPGTPEGRSDTFHEMNFRLWH